ncbi:TolC family outer membrane protein [Paramagnetospirillum magneticum]|uniref:Outer membrane protein n=1 Tax=Paramagnetospirillum magneticum (strain ATCC 700264 / AMB-1) TaxID=342108 RepID=Q2W2R0_PARM1|nr:TolC family outer membrane protein [Paramagnetospirillum magneticum]BAE51865.1 Outer membrane protein [Paramagnetospirillum magneticum AMB-1]
MHTLGNVVIRSRRLRLWALATTVLAAYWTPVVAGTLEDEMRELVATNPQIQAKMKGVNSADEGIRVARAGYLPTVKLSGDQGHEYIDSPDRRGTQGKPFMDKRNTSGLTVTQKIFDGFATDSTVESAKSTRRISESDLRATRQATLLEGAIAYLDVMRTTKLVALSRENERKVAEQQNLEDERVQKGSGIASDVLQAKQRLQLAKERRVNYEGEFHAAVARFTQVFGHAPDVASLSDPPLPLDLIPETLDQSLEAAEKDNPTLESASSSIVLSGEKRNIAEAGYYPTLDLVGKADYEHGKNATVGVRRDWSLMLVASWELFSGFKTDASVAQASWDHGVSKDNRYHTSRKTAEQTRTAWHKIQTARQRLDLLENAAVLAEEVWAATMKKRDAGKATVTEVLDEETRINEARINYTGAYYSMYQASYELIALMGRLEVDNLSRAKPASSLDVTPLKSVDYTYPKDKAPKPQAARPAPPVARAAPAAPATTAIAAAEPTSTEGQAANAAVMERVRDLVATQQQTEHSSFWTVR